MCYAARMASTDNFLELLENPEFKILVAQIMAAVTKTHKDGTVSDNIAKDALLFVNALLYDASPNNEGPKGLRDAQNQISADAKSMLQFIRDTGLRQGKPLLFTMTQRPTLN
jgi:hypothetical protein